VRPTGKVEMSSQAGGAVSGSRGRVGSLLAAMTVAGPRRTRTGFLVPARDLQFSRLTLDNRARARQDGVTAATRLPAGPPPPVVSR